MLRRTCLQPDTRHVFAVNPDEPIAAVRLDAFPDGGISRVRVIGSVDPAARRAAGYRWFNALPESHAVECLVKAGMLEPQARQLANQRPLSMPASIPTDAALLRAILEGA